MKVDNHMLSTFGTCALKYYESIEEHWNPRFKGGALGHGIAIHAGLAEWYRAMRDGEGASVGATKGLIAIEDNWAPDHPPDDFRTLIRAKEMFLRYIKEYPGETFQIIDVETSFTFSTDYFLDVCPHCGHRHERSAARKELCDSCKAEREVIEYGGIYDLLVQFGSGKMSTLYVADHKTTSQLGSTYFLQFKPNNQISGYCWGAKKSSDRTVGGAIINALCMTTAGNMNFKRSMTDRNEKDEEEWLKDVVARCNQIRECQITGVWPKSTDQCQGKYGMCSFHSVHVLSEASERLQRLQTDYVKAKWDFENRDEGVASV